MSLAEDVVQHAWFSVPILKATTSRASADVTDYDWYELLASRTRLDEVKFWKSGDSHRSQDSQDGELLRMGLGRSRLAPRAC